MSKYKQQVEEMLERNKEMFDSFKDIHDKYALDPKKWQAKFNEEGEEVVYIIQRWENNLCSKSESGKYGKFSNTLADKFWTEIRLLFPKIDFVGIEPRGQ